jgi:hypothetical protein
MQMQRYAESIEDCGAALELDNSCLAAMVQRGKSYMELQEWEKAVRHCKFIFSSVVDPHHVDADPDLYFMRIRIFI